MFETAFSTFGNILLAVLGISFLIFMHELGHYLAARLFKVHVEVFSIGFGPRLLGWSRGQTDYRVSLIPLGGYVKMAGEYADADDDRPPREDDLLSKPIWQRFIVFLAGPAMNFALAFVMFPVAFGGGTPFVAPVIGDVSPAGPAWQAGLQPGDEFVSINGRRIYGFSDVLMEIALCDPLHTSARMRRDGQERDVPLEPVSAGGLYALMIRPQTPILSPAEGGPAERAGLITGDILLAANQWRVGEPLRGTPLSAARALSLAMIQEGPLDLLVQRDGQQTPLQIPPGPVPKAMTSRAWAPCPSSPTWPACAAPPGAPTIR